MALSLRGRTTRPTGWDVGVTVTGEALLIPPTLHCLLAGLSRSGKSTALRCVLARAATEPVALALIDLKRVEFPAWRPRAMALAVDQPAAVELLAGLCAEVDHRYHELETAGLVEWTADLGPRIVLVVDELALLLAGADRRANDQAAAHLRDLLAIGAAAGVTVIAATQRPSHNVISADLRDLFQSRIGFAAGGETWNAMIGMEGAELHRLPVGPEHAGRCMVLLDGQRTATPARISWLSPDRVPAIAAATAHLRPALDLTPSSPTISAVTTSPPPTAAPSPTPSDRTSNTADPFARPSLAPNEPTTPNPAPTPPTTTPPPLHRHHVPSPLVDASSATDRPQTTTSSSSSSLTDLDHAILTTLAAHSSPPLDARRLYDLIRPHLTTSRTSIARTLVTLAAADLIDLDDHGRATCRR